MAFIALAFAAGTLSFPASVSLADRYPVAVQLSYVLIPNALAGGLALTMGWRWLRVGTSIAAFLAWGLLGLGCLAAFADVGMRHGLLFLAFALIELSIFVRLHLRMEELREVLDAAVVANNITVELTGHAINARGNGDAGATEKRL